MYLEHFQLKSQPFSEHATVAALWQDQRMDEGLARLEYLIQSGQLGVVTGPSGVGKSALLKRFLHGMLPQPSASDTSGKRAATRNRRRLRQPSSP